METFIINTIIAILLGIIPYLVKYKKKYNLIAGYSDYKKENLSKNHSIEENAILISNYIFLFCGLIIFFSILNLFVKFEIAQSKLHSDLIGLYIIIFSAIISAIAFVIHKLLKKT